MHNLSNYDSHLFIKELGKYTEKLNIIPENSEKCISVSQKLQLITIGIKRWVDIYVINSIIKVS